ncbi:ABC transporter permease [Jeotgalibacillus sp. ET6]|uniref:ABC transporter permease n=1 Tax=Jeotgalibacillus sp. ET6 TaxID=3037260 RepID=UPI0024181D1B|nr:ABC transporter permease [Jeotgalibacillus sp. ET6]MDG5473549.1 ABC transporter permease [Jeotgalibacillus sp. ET6]
MIGILLARIRLFIRKPLTFVIFTGMSIGFALVLGGSGGPAAVHVPLYAEDQEVQDSFIGNALVENETYSFDWTSKAELEERITNGKAEAGAILTNDGYRLIIGVDSPNAALIENTLSDLYRKKHQEEEIMAASGRENQADQEKLLNELRLSQESPVFTISNSHFRGTNTWMYDSTFQTLFGFTLFFVIYTIAYNVLPILIEKKDGIWYRIILSPVKKWEMYTANLLYTFFEGYLQVVIIFLIFRYWVGVDFNGRFIEALLFVIPYVFAIVAMSIFLTALVKTTQQFNAVIPILAISMAMIGGAYWPIEIVESEFLLALSKINPLTYGMEILNGIAVYGFQIDELLFPISILVIMGVVMMGLGIHLMEKRHV